MFSGRNCSLSQSGNALAAEGKRNKHQDSQSARIVDDIPRAMTAKGLTRVEVEPEITVVVLTATESDMHISYPSWAPAFNFISNGIVVGSQMWPVTRGTLVVDLSDTRTTNCVWRATATDTLKHGPTINAAKDAKSVEKQIRKAVDKMFKRFPHPNQH